MKRPAFSLALILSLFLLAACRPGNEPPPPKPQPVTFFGGGAGETVVTVGTDILAGIYRVTVPKSTEPGDDELDKTVGVCFWAMTHSLGEHDKPFLSGAGHTGDRLTITIPGPSKDGPVFVYTSRCGQWLRDPDVALVSPT